VQNWRTTREGADKEYERAGRLLARGRGSSGGCAWCVCVGERERERVRRGSYREGLGEEERERGKQDEGATVAAARRRPR
jgi:hypothetical protein